VTNLNGLSSIFLLFLIADVLGLISIVIIRDYRIVQKNQLNLLYRLHTTTV
jgi:hypothetical protein